MRRIIINVSGLSLDAASQHLPSFSNLEEELIKFLAEKGMKLEVKFSFIHSPSGLLSFKHSAYELGEKRTELDVKVKKIFFDTLGSLTDQIGVQEIGPEFGSNAIELIKEKRVEIESKN